MGEIAAIDPTGRHLMLADMAMKVAAARQLTYAAAARSERAVAGEKVPAGSTDRLDDPTSAFRNRHRG